MALVEHLDDGRWYIYIYIYKKNLIKKTYRHNTKFQKHYIYIYVLLAAAWRCYWPLCIIYVMVLKFCIVCKFF